MERVRGRGERNWGGTGWGKVFGDGSTGLLVESLSWGQGADQLLLTASVAEQNKF